MLKKIFLIIFGLIGLLLIAAIITPFVVDVDDFRPRILEQVNKRIQGNLEIEKIEASIFEGIKLHGVKLTNPEGFGEPTLLTVSRAHVSANIIGLIKGDLKLVTRFADPQITFERSETGWNVQQLLKPKAEEEIDAGGKPTDTKVSFLAGWFKNPALSMRIRRANITVVDQLKQRRIEISAVDLDLTNLKMNEPIQLDVEGDFDAALLDKWDTKGRLGFRGTLFPQLGEGGKMTSATVDGTIDLTKMLIVREGIINKQPGTPSTIKTEGVYDAKNKLVDVTKFIFKLGEMNIDGTFQLPLTKPLTLSAALTMNNFNATEVGKSSPLISKYLDAGTLEGNFDGAIYLSPIKFEGGGSLKSQNLLLKLPIKQSPKMKWRGPMTVTSEVTYQVEGKSLTEVKGNGIFNLDKTEILIPKKFRKAKGVIFNVSGPLQYKEKRLTFKQAAIKLHNLQGTTSGSVTFGNDSYLDLSFKASKTDINGWQTIFPRLGEYVPKGAVTIDKLVLRGPTKSLGKGQIEADLQLEKLTIGAEVFKTKKLSAKGPLHTDGSLSFKFDKGKLGRGDANITLNMSETTLRQAGKFSKPAGSKLEGRFKLTGTDDQITISSGTIQALNTSITLNGTIPSLKKKIVNLDLKFKPFELKPWTTVLDGLKNFAINGNVDGTLKIEGPINQSNMLKFGGYASLSNGRGRLSGIQVPVENLSAKVKFSDNGALLENFLIKIGKSDLSLTGRLTEFKNPRGTIKVTSNYLDLDELFPPEPAKGPGTVAPTSPQRTAKPSDSFKIFRESKFWKKAILKGTLKVNKLKSLKLDLGPLTASLNYRNQTFLLEDFSLDVYDGRMTANSELNTALFPATFTMWGRTKDINLQKLLTAKNPKLKDSAEGLMSSDFHLEGRGFSKGEVRKNLTGRGKFSIKDGEFKTLDVTESIYAALEAIPGVKLKERPTEDRFQYANTKFVIKNGKVQTDNLYLRGQGFSIKARGHFTFDQQLSYRGDYFLSLEEDPIEAIPFIISGPLSKPSIKPDIREYVKRYLETTVEDVIREGAEKLFRELGR